MNKRNLRDKSPSKTTVFSYCGIFTANSRILAGKAGLCNTVSLFNTAFKGPLARGFTTVSLPPFRPLYRFKDYRIPYPSLNDNSEPTINAAGREVIDSYSVSYHYSQQNIFRVCANAQSYPLLSKNLFLFKNSVLNNYRIKPQSNGLDFFSAYQQRRQRTDKLIRQVFESDTNVTPSYTNDVVTLNRTNSDKMGYGVEQVHFPFGFNVKAEDNPFRVDQYSNDQFSQNKYSDLKSCNKLKNYIDLDNDSDPKNYNELKSCSGLKKYSGLKDYCRPVSWRNHKMKTLSSKSFVNDSQIHRKLPGKTTTAVCAGKTGADSIYTNYGSDNGAIPAFALQREAIKKTIATLATTNTESQRENKTQFSILQQQLKNVEQLNNQDMLHLRRALTELKDMLRTSKPSVVSHSIRPPSLYGRFK